MKTISAALAITLLLIAPHARSMSVNGAFHSINPLVQVAAKSAEGSPKKLKKSKAKKGSNIAFHDGSAESRSERDRRLKRECKGQVNAGVCAGYTR